MSNRTALQTADAEEPHKFIDLVIPLTFSAVALLAAAVPVHDPAGGGRVRHRQPAAVVGVVAHDAGRACEDQVPEVDVTPAAVTDRRPMNVHTVS